VKVGPAHADGFTSRIVILHPCVHGDKVRHSQHAREIARVITKDYV
jgi:hypothetical protein